MSGKAGNPPEQSHSIYYTQTLGCITPLQSKVLDSTTGHKIRNYISPCWVYKIMHKHTQIKTQEDCKKY